MPAAATTKNCAGVRGDPEWENESVFQYQAGLDVEMPGEIDRPVVRIERPG